MTCDLTHNDLTELLQYHRDTGVFTWRVKTGNRRAGTVAGSKKPDGYVRICLKGRFYAAHRLAWFYETGNWPTSEIDHVNRRRDDNRFINLRDTSGTENQHNTGLRSDNKTGMKGVRYDKRRQKWEARIRVKGKLLHLGRFATAELAQQAYSAARRSHGLRPMDLAAAYRATRTNSGEFV